MRSVRRIMGGEAGRGEGARAGQGRVGNNRRVGGSTVQTFKSLGVLERAVLLCSAILLVG